VLGSADDADGLLRGACQGLSRLRARNVCQLVERRPNRRRSKRRRPTDGHVVDVADVLVSPEVRVDDAQRLERVVDVRDGRPAALEKAARTRRA
jgi:predicted polyphosphate/ATP-dependent NAD kinase